MNRFTKKIISKCAPCNINTSELFKGSKRARYTRLLLILMCTLNVILNLLFFSSPEKPIIAILLLIFQITCLHLDVRLKIFLQWIRIPADSLTLVFVLYDMASRIGVESQRVVSFLQGLYLGIYLSDSNKKSPWPFQSVILLADFILFLGLQNNYSWDFMILLIFPGLIILFLLGNILEKEPLLPPPEKGGELTGIEQRLYLKEIFRDLFRLDSAASFQISLENFLNNNNDKQKLPSIEENCMISDEYQKEDEILNLFFNKNSLFSVSDKLRQEQDENFDSLIELLHQPIIEAIEDQEIFNYFSKENLSIANYFHMALNNHITEIISRENDKPLKKFKPFSKKLNCSQYDNVNPISLRYGPRFRVYLSTFCLEKSVFIVVKFRKESDKKKIKELLKDEHDMTLFLASIVHDLRSPLVGIEYMIEAATEAVRDKEIAHKNLVMARSNCQLLSCLIDDILDFTSSKNNKFRIVLSYFCLNELINDVIAIMKPDADLRNLTLQYFCPIPYDMRVNSDPKRLKQVLINLISNALKFTAAGSVRVTAIKKDDYIIEIHVIDTGSGIKRETLSSLSQPYLSIDNEAGANKRGIGLGLHNCKQILKFLGPGGLIINSKEGSGSDFGFQIYRDVHNPSSNFFSSSASNKEESKSKNRLFSRRLTFKSLNTEEYEVDTIKTNEIMMQRNFVASIKRPNSEEFPNKRRFYCYESHAPSLSVLIVDDNPFNLLVLEKYLHAVKTLLITVQKGLNGEGALEIFRAMNSPGSSSPVNLIFLDIQLPLKDGFQVSEEISKLIAEEGYEKCSVFGISGLVEEKDKILALKSGMKSILTKPTDMATIQKICEELVF